MVSTTPDIVIKYRYNQQIETFTKIGFSLNMYKIKTKIAASTHGNLNTIPSCTSQSDRPQNIHRIKLQ